MKRPHDSEPRLRRDADEPLEAKSALAPAERLLFAALQGWATLRARGERPHSHIAPLLAHKTSGRAAALFVAWIEAVEAESVRPLQIECPSCGGPAPDAQRLIVACGVAPVAPALAESLLAPLLLGHATVIQLGKSLNAALAAEGWPLPARVESPPPVADRPPRSRTLH